MDLSFLKEKKDFIFMGTQNYINECYRSAIENFTLSIKENKKNTAAYLYRAYTYIALGDYQSALPDLDEVEKTGDKLFEVHYKKGMCYFLTNDYPASHEHLLKAIAVSQGAEQRENVDKWMSKLKIELPKDVLNKLLPTNVSGSNQLMFKQSWKQDPHFIFVNLEASSPLESNKLVVNIEKRIVSIFYNGSEVYSLTLCNGIIPEKCTKEVETSNIVLGLKKEIENFNWINVDKAKESVDDIRQAYPSSAKNKKNWDNVEKEINKQLQAEPDEEGINTLFKEIYSRGDEATRRAMVKSFQTSGGTVLSTNWGEVKDKDYEGRDRPDAPKGQEWKKPES